MPSYTGIFENMARGGYGGLGGAMTGGGLPSFRGQLRAGQEAGYFTPGGAKQRAAFRRRRIGDVGARQARTRAYGQLSGLDPMQQRNALLESEIDSTGEMFNQLGGYDLQQIMDEQNYYRSLLPQYEEMRQRERERKSAERGGAMGAIGQIGGAVIGGLLPFSASRAPRSTRGGTAGPAYRPTYREEEYRYPY